jgi:hypothetical protein
MHLLSPARLTATVVAHAAGRAGGGIYFCFADISVSNVNEKLCQLDATS